MLMYLYCLAHKQLYHFVISFHKLRVDRYQASLTWIERSTLIVDFQMLCSRMKRRIGRNVECALVVTIKIYRSIFMFTWIYWQSQLLFDSATFGMKWIFLKLSIQPILPRQDFKYLNTHGATWKWMHGWSR